MIANFYEELQPLIYIDPLLLPMLAYSCQQEELPAVFRVLPTYLSVALIMKLYLPPNKHHINVDEVCIVQYNIILVLSVSIPLCID